MLKRKINVLFDGKVFYPQKPVNLKPNIHYTAIIENKKKEKIVSNKTFKNILERSRDLGIKDLSKQHDHYLYGMYN